MNKNYYAPICRRADGSIYLDKSTNFTRFLSGAAAILFFTLIFTAIVLFALIDTSASKTPDHENTPQSGEISYQRNTK